MGILDTIMRHTKKEYEEGPVATSRLAEIVAQHEAAAQVQASLEWQNRRPNVGLDPGTHPVLLQAAEEKAREEQQARINRWGAIASLPASQVYGGINDLRNPGAAYFSYKAQAKQAEDEKKKQTAPYRNSSPYTSTMSPWLSNYTAKKEEPEDKGTKITSVTSTMSPYLGNYSKEYSESWGNVPEENRKRAMALQSEVDELQKQINAIPLRYVTSDSVLKTKDAQRRAELVQEKNDKLQAIEMLRSGEPINITNTSSVYVDQMLKDENRRLAETEEERKRKEARAEERRKFNEAAIKQQKQREEDDKVLAEYEAAQASGSNVGPELEEAARSIYEKRAQEEEARKNAGHTTYNTGIFGYQSDDPYTNLLTYSSSVPSMAVPFLSDNDRANYYLSKNLQNPEIEYGSKLLANVSLSRAALDKNKAWSMYMHNPTEANRKIAESMSRSYENRADKNSDIINRDDSVGNLVTEHLAQYLPQAYDQFHYQLPGAVFGALLGGGSGLKAGRVIGNTIYSYETTSGAAFENLINQGVDLETARAAAMDEAVLSTIVEDMDLIIDMFTTGFGKASSALFGTNVSGFDAALEKWVGESTWKKWAVALGKYGLNIASEANEEGTQEAISIANENLRQQGKRISITELALSALNIYTDALLNEDSENRDRILEAAKGGAALALVNAPLESVGNTAVSTGKSVLNGRQIRMNNEIDNTVQNGLYNDPSARAYQLAEQIQAGQNRTAGNRLQEIAYQMQQDYRLGQLAAENSYNESAMTEAERLVRNLAEKAGTGERITNSEVARVLGNDLAVLELEQASGTEISTTGTRTDRVAAVRDALSVAAEHYKRADLLEQAEQSNIFSTTNQNAANGAISSSESGLNLSNASWIAAQSDRGQRMNAEFSSPAISNLSKFAEERRKEQQKQQQEMTRRSNIEAFEQEKEQAKEDFRKQVEENRKMEPTQWIDELEKSEESPNWDNKQLTDYAYTLGANGAGAYVSGWQNNQDVAQYTREWTQYYNAGVTGANIDEVGDISTQILTQNQRKQAYISGIRDLRTDSVKEAVNEFQNEGRTESVGNSSRRNAGVGANEQGGNSYYWKDEVQRRDRAQRKFASEIRDAAREEGLTPVSSASLNIPGGTSNSKMILIQEGSALYTNDMRAVANRMKAMGTEVRYFIGEMEIAFPTEDGESMISTSNGMHIPEQKMIYVQVDNIGQIVSLDWKQIVKHEEFHMLKNLYSDLYDEVRGRVNEMYDQAQLEDLREKYVNEYGYKWDETLEEIYADAYATVDRVAPHLNAYESSGKYAEVVQHIGQKYADRAIQEQEVREREGNQDQAEDGFRFSSNPSGLATSIKFDPAEHTQEEIQLFNEYLNAVDPDLLRFVKRYNNTNVSGADKITVTTVGDHLGNKLKDLTGHEYEGYKVLINQSHVQHIYNEHGISGGTNHTMALAEDVARIPWVLNHADSVEWSRMADGRIKFDRSFLDKDHKRMLNVEIRKKIDNTFIVILATGETKHKELNIVTAYLETTEKGSVPGIPNTGNTAFGRTSVTSPTSTNPSKNTLSQQQENVKNEGPKLSRNAVNAINETAENDEITRKVENGEGLSPAEEVRFSLNLDADFVEKERAFKQSFVNSDVLTESFAQREFVRNKLMQPGIRELLPEDKMGKTSFGNGSYGRSMEHSTICPRTLSMEAILDGLSEKFGRPITVDESIKISQLAWAYMDAPECAYCYVAMDRKAKREYLLNYMTSRNEVFKNIDSGMSREDAYNAFLNGRKDTKPMKDRFNNWVRMHENGTEMIEMKDLASDRAIKAASEKSKSMADQVKDALKYAQSASWAKKYVQYTAYNGEILKWNQKLVNSLNRMYGMRMYSFSDFHPAFTLEDMQMVTDASLRGLKVLAYTKELDFARIMEPTGANINISVFAQNTKDVNGNYGMDAMQGADWEEAKALRAKSIKNGTGIGITMVCTNDDQVEWALGQEWIDVVIPFHMVKTGAKVAEHFGWTNYTDMQGDKKLKDLWDGKANEAMIEPPEHQNNKQLYLEALEQNNLSPRFEKWVDNPNYMKLVNETRRAEGETPTVQPKFNLDAADAMFDKMQKQGGYYQHLGLETDVFEDLQDEIYDEYVEKYGEPAKFSLNKPVERTKDFIAVHNKNIDAILDAVKLGGFPSPSIAIVDAAEGHTKYGDVSVIFRKEAIDPEADPRNKVYGSDAWTPTQNNARVEYEVDRTKLRDIENRIRTLSAKVAGGAFEDTSALRALGIDDSTEYSIDRIAERLAGMDSVKAAYLASRGEDIETQYKAKKYDVRVDNEFLQKLTDHFGSQRLAQMQADILSGDFSAEEREEIRDFWKREERKKPFYDRIAEKRGEDVVTQRIESRASEMYDTILEDFVSHAWEMYEDQGTAKSDVIDKLAMSNTLRETVETKDVEEWVRQELDGLLGEPGIYNGQDPFTRSGNRKSFSQLHWAYTAENIVRAMNNAESRGEGYWGAGASGMQAVASTEFRNISEMHREESRLFQESEEEHRNRLKSVDNQIDSIYADVEKLNTPHASNTFEEREIVGYVLMKAAQGKRTAAAVKNYFRKEGYSISDRIANNILKMYKDAAAIPTGYFEAKPQRVVNFNEVAAIVAPDNIKPESLQQIRDAGMQVVTYKAGDDADRLRAMNSVDNTKFSRNRRVSEDAQKTITGQQMDLEQKLMQTAELLKAAEKENKKLQAQLTEAQRNMRITKEKTALESSVQRAADKLLKNYDVFPDDKERYNEIKYDVASTLEKMRNVVLNVKDPEVYEQTLRRTAMTMTDKIISGMKRLMSTDSDTYQQIKQYLRAKPGITISETDKSSMRDYNAFRKRNMGRINLTNSGIPVDTAYQEMQQLYGKGYFPDDIMNPADQLYRMEEVMQTLEPVYENFNSYEIAEMKEYMASDLENEILDIVMGDAIKSVPPTEADKIVAQYESKIAGIEKSFNERLSEMQAKNKDKINKIVDNERDYRTKTEQKVRDYYRELDAERRARRVDSDARTRLLKIARRLSSNKKLSTPNKALLQQYIGDLDLVAKSITRQTLDKLSDLKLWYDTEKATNPDFIPDPRTEAKLQRLSRWKISELSIQEVKDLTEVLLHIEHEDRTQRYLIEAEDKRDIYIQGEETIRNIHFATGVKSGALGKLDSLFVNGTLSPMRAMHRITGYNEKDPLYRATKWLADGQRKMYDFQMRAGQMFTKWTEDRAFVKEISGKNAKSIAIRPGVYITPDMRMSLYLHLKNDENLRHISSGGVTIPDMKLYRKGDIAEAYNRGKTIKLKKSEVEAIVQGMSEKEKAFADQAAKYFGEMSQKAINETSELLKGYALAEVKNYFPINTDKNFTRSDFESLKMDGTIEGMGFLKERVQASNPIYLRDMSDVLKQSIEMTGKYVGLAIPVRNFNKLWNVATGEKNPEGKYTSFFDGSVKQEVSKKWGDPGMKYIENMMTDLQNGRKSKSDWSKVLGKVRSHYAQAVLTLNASVALKQAASYPTAGAVLGWKPILRALADVGKVDTEKINQYTPLLWYRTQGFSTQELGDMKQRGMQLPKVLNWVQGMDVLTTRKLWKASEYYIRDQRKDLKVGSDEYYKAVADIYNRVIEETQPNYTTMQRPQLLRQDDTLLSSLMMFKTQPFQNFNIMYDAIGNWMAKEQQYKQNTNAETEAAVKAARRDAANAITSQVAQLAVFAGMTFAWAMFRGKKDKYEDEDGEQTFGSTMKGIGKDMLGNAFSGIPFGSDAWEFISSKIFGDKYYGFDVAVASSIEDLLNAFTKAGNAISEVFSVVTNKDKSLADINWNDQRMNLKSVVYAVAKIAGVPIENVEKFASAAFRHAAKGVAGKYEGEYAYLRLTTSENKSSSDYYDLLWRAYKNDPEAYKKLYDQMVNLNGLNADKIKSAMEKKMKAEEGVTSVSDLSQRYMAPDVQEAYDALLDPIDDSATWTNASLEAQGKLESKLYEIAAGTDRGTGYQQKMDTFESQGIDNTTYLLYQLALDIADEQGNGNGSYDNSEKEAAIRMLGLTDKQSYDLWEAQSTSKTDKNNPWKK